MKKTLLLFYFVIYAFITNAQKPIFTIGSQRDLTTLTNPETVSFRIGQNNYVLFKKFDLMKGTLMHLEGFTDPTDGYLCSQDIEVPQAPNEIALYEGFVPLYNKMLLFRSVFKKDEKRDVLYVHEVNEKGIVATSGKEVATISAEKALNAGNFIIKASEDRKQFVIVAEAPFVKETKEKFTVTVYDAAINKLWSKELELQYECKKAPSNEPILANNGSVYIIKKLTISKTPEFYTVYQVSNNGATVKESVLETEAPKKIVNYDYIFNEQNDLFISGFYTEDGKVSVSFGGVNFKGSFIYKISASNGSITAKNTNAFEKTLSSLKVINVVYLNGKIVLLGEHNYENSTATDQKDSRGFPVYRQDYYADDIQVTTFDENGKTLAYYAIKKDNKSTEDGGFRNSFSSSIVGSQLMLVYNDYQYRNDGLEHKIVGPMLAGIKIPIIQFIAEDGSLGKKIVMIDSNVGGKTGEVALFPNIYIPVKEKEFFYLSRGDKGTFHPVRMKLP